MSATSKRPTYCEQALLERVSDALSNVKMSSEQILALANECFDAGLKKQRDQLVAHATLVQHVKLYTGRANPLFE